MQVEAVIIVGDSNDIIFACHCLPSTKNWNEYLERLVKLIPGWDPPTPFLLFDDIVIGCALLKDIRIIVTAPLSSNFAIAQVMDQAVGQIKNIVNYVAKEEPFQAALLKRDPYIHLQVLMQAEISASGHMRFGSTTDFATIVPI
jgi:disulfide oxidoreductase YuzD